MTEQEYKEALKRVEKIFDCSENSPEFLEFSKLVDQIVEYEDIHYPIGLPHPIEAIKIRQEDLCLDDENISKLLGMSSKEFKDMLRTEKVAQHIVPKLVEQLGLPKEIFEQNS